MGGKEPAAAGPGLDQDSSWCSITKVLTNAHLQKVSDQWLDGGTVYREQPRACKRTEIVSKVTRFAAHTTPAAAGPGLTLILAAATDRNKIRSSEMS